MFLYIKTNILRGYGIFKNDFAHPREPATDRYGVKGVSGVGIIHGHHFAHIITTDVHFLHSLVIVAELKHTASSRASFSNVILK